MEIKRLSDSGEPVVTETNIFNKELMKIYGNFAKKLLPSHYVALVEFVRDMRNYRSVKNLGVIFQKLHNDNVTAEDLKKHSEELRLHPDLQEEEQEQLIFMLESHSREIQSLVFAKFYEALLEKNITFEQFLELAEVNRRMFAEDYVGLWAAGMGGIPVGTKLKRTTYSYQKERLVGLGLLERDIKTEQFSYVLDDGKRIDKSMAIGDLEYKITELGSAFYQYSQDEKLLNKYFYDNE